MAYYSTDLLSAAAAAGSQPVGDQVPPSYAQVRQFDDAYVISSPDMLSLGTGVMAWLDSTASLGYQFAQSLFTPTLSQTLLPGSTTTIEDDPLILSSGILVTVPVSSMIWTDAARAPQIIPTLLWIVP